MATINAYRRMTGLGSSVSAEPVMMMDPEYITGTVPTSIPWFLIAGGVLAFLLMRKK